MEILWVGFVGVLRLDVQIQNTGSLKQHFSASNLLQQRGQQQ
jgi:hypothetical protein